MKICVGGVCPKIYKANLFWTIHQNISTTLPVQIERVWILENMTEVFCFFIRPCWDSAQGLLHMDPSYNYCDYSS